MFKVYIDVYCDEGTEKITSQIPVARIQDVALCKILFTILMLLGSVEPHLANPVVMYYYVVCMTPTVFDRCSSLLDTVRGKLTSCRTRRMNSFGFRSLICSYFFERILSLSLQIQLLAAPPQEPRMVHWCDLWWRLGGGFHHHRDVGFYA